MILAEIPLIPGIPQRFTISLSRVEYNCTMKWNSANNLWMLDIADTNGAMKVAGVPLVTGVNLLDQFDHLGFAGRLFAWSDFDVSAPPTFGNLGLTGHLVYITD